MSLALAEALPVVRELVEAVAKTNSSGRLYPAPVRGTLDEHERDLVRGALDELVSLGVLLGVDTTATSLRSYVARPDSLARLERAANEVSR